MTKPHQPWFVRRPIPSVVQRIHLIGIAGAAMGAFATMLQEAGYEVRGSDRNVYPPMSDVLTKRGIRWMEGFAAEHLDWAPDLVVVGNVCRRDNPEAVEAERRGIAAVSFPQCFSDLFLAGRHPVVVTGTHGKTTTTALTAWLLHRAGELDPGLLVGGVSRNFDSTYRIGSGPPFVVEGDEYDTAYFDKGPKFLHYRPKTVILNNIEFDHADIYDDLEEIIENFDRLMDLMHADTLLIANFDDQRVMERAKRAQGRVVTYGFGEGADLQAIDAVPGPHGCSFTLVHQGRVLGVAVSPMPGRYNLWNVLAAFAVGFEFGVPFEKLAPALQEYAGVKKRQEERGEVGGVLVVDDYAHHPTAVLETLRALRARYPGRRLWAIYEPKSNTARRNIHQQDYARAFDAADRVVLAAPYAKDDGLGRESMLDVATLVGQIGDGGPAATFLPGVEAILAHLVAETTAGDVVVVMANSGFGGLIEKLLAGLTARFSGAAGG